MEDKKQHFRRFTLTPAEKPKETLEGRETVEEFLARGGEIVKIPTGVAATRETGNYEKRKNSRKKYAQDTFRRRQERKRRTNKGKGLGTFPS